MGSVVATPLSKCHTLILMALLPTHPRVQDFRTVISWQQLTVPGDSTTHCTALCYRQYNLRRFKRLASQSKNSSHFSQRPENTTLINSVFRPKPKFSSTWTVALSQHTRGDHVCISLPLWQGTTLQTTLPAVLQAAAITTNQTLQSNIRS